MTRGHAYGHNSGTRASPSRHVFHRPDPGPVDTALKDFLLAKASAHGLTPPRSTRTRTRRTGAGRVREIPGHGEVRPKDTECPGGAFLERASVAAQRDAGPHPAGGHDGTSAGRHRQRRLEEAVRRRELVGLGRATAAPRAAPAAGSPATTCGGRPAAAPGSASVARRDACSRTAPEPTASPTCTRSRSTTAPEPQHAGHGTEAGLSAQRRRRARCRQLHLLHS